MRRRPRPARRRRPEQAWAGRVVYFPQPSRRPGSNGGSTWAVVLAGGSGARLASWIAARNGTSVPKQYCSLRGGRSLLADALRRADSEIPAPGPPRQLIST